MTTRSQQPRYDVLPVLRVAAEMKAAGHSWTTIATRVKRCERTLRRWKDQYPECWGKLFFEACEEAFQRVSGMALSHLSNLVNNKEHPQQWRSCHFMFGKWFDLMVTIMKLQCRQPPAPAVGAFWREAIQQIESESQEQLTEEILDYADTLRKRADDQAAADGKPTDGSAA